MIKVGTYRNYWYEATNCTIFRNGRNCEGTSVKIRNLEDRRDWHVYGGQRIGLKRIQNRIDKIIASKEE